MIRDPLSGAVENVMGLPAAFGTTFFFRFFVPGLVVSLASIPLWPPAWTTRPDLSGLGIYLFGVFALGIILRGCYLLLTSILLGGTFPQRVRNQLISRLQRHLDWAQKIMAEPFPPNYSSLNPLFWNRGRASRFIRMMPYIPMQASAPDQPPTEALQPTVTLPTVWGNIWAAFSFDMERCFPDAHSRWLGRPVHAIARATYAISTGARREMEELASYSDAALSVSVGLGALVLAYVWVTLQRGWMPVPHGHVANLLMVGVCLIGAYLTYIISVDQLNSALEYFRAVVLKEHPEPASSLR